MKGRTIAWDTKDEVEFTRAHEVGVRPAELGEVWTDFGSIPDKKDVFAALTLGDTIWLVGDETIHPEDGTDPGPDNNKGADKVYKSINKGETWTTIDATFTGLGIEELSGVTGFAFAADKLFVATSKHIYKSTDDGKTWNSVQAVTGTTDGFKVAHIKDGANKGVYFIGGNDSGTIFKSTDNGESWGLIETAQADRFENREAIGMGVAVFGQTIYVMGGWGPGLLSVSGNDVWKSDNGGVKWTQVVGVEPTTTTRWSLRDRMSAVSTETHVYVIAGKPTGKPSDESYVGGIDVWRALGTDLSTWELVSDGVGERNSAEAIYYPTDKSILIIGGQNKFSQGMTSVQRTEVEK